MSKRIGFDRYITIEWLDMIAGLLQHENDINKIRASMHSYLEKELPHYESRKKTISILLRIWYKVPDEYRPLRDRAIKILSTASQEDRIWIHWGMTLLAFPFFRDIITWLHRCFTLHDHCTMGEVHRKIEESWGYRTTMKPAIRKVIQSLILWGAIDKNLNSHVITRKKSFAASIKEIEFWFLYAILASENSHSIPVERMNNIPAAFPFLLTINPSDLVKSENFSLQMVGGKTEIVLTEENV